MSADVPAGTVRRHPDWPAEPVLAMRSAFTDDQFPGWTSWIALSPTGSSFVTAESVADWPEAAITGDP